MPNATPRRLGFWVLVGLSSVACTTTAAPPPAPAPTPTAADSATVLPPHVARWTPERSAGSWRYELRSSGTVSLAGDTTAIALPLGKTVVYTVSITPSTDTANSGMAFQLAGSVDSVAVTIPERIPTPTAGSNSKPHFQGTLAHDGHVTAVASNATSPCTATTDPLSAATVSLFVALPRKLSPTTTWADTVSTTTCRGRMPIITTATRQYRAITDTTWNGRPAILITRMDSLAISSRPDSLTDSLATTGDTAATKADAMEATGHGRGDFTLLVDPFSGVLLQAIGTSQTEIVVATGSSHFPFHEEARQTITLLPD